MTHALEQAAPSAGPVEIRTSPGIIDVTAPALFAGDDDHAIHTLIERLFEAPAVEAVSVDRLRHTVEIEYDPQSLESQTALRTFAHSLRSADQLRPATFVRQYLDRVPGRIKRVERRVPDDAILMVENLIVEFDPEPQSFRHGPPRIGIPELVPPAGSLPADVTKPWMGEIVIGGVRRLVNLTAAGGCLVMSIVGFVTPGIPTVPFVLATGYFLARSSPALHRRFRRSRLFGQMVSDYEDRGGLRWSTKRNMILLTGGLVVVTAAVAGFNVPVMILVGVMGSVGVYLVMRIPTVSSDAPAGNLAPATA